MSLPNKGDMVEFEILDGERVRGIVKYVGKRIRVVAKLDHGHTTATIWVPAARWAVWLESNATIAAS